MRKVVVEIDNREKNPLLFPPQVIWSPRSGKREIASVTTVTKQLKTADYRLAGHPHDCLIERKAGLAELAQNLLSEDRHRFYDAWARFTTNCHRPVLLIDGSLADFDKLPPGVDYHPAEVQRAFWGLLQAYPFVWVIFAGNTVSPVTRQKLGAQLVRLMLDATLC